MQPIVHYILTQNKTPKHPLIGETFGTLTVLGGAGVNSSRNPLYAVKCVCGNVETRTQDSIRSTTQYFWKACKRCSRLFRNYGMFKL